MKRVILFSVIIFLFGCDNDEINQITKDNSGVIIRKPYIWKNQLYYGNSSSKSFIISPSVIINNNIFQGVIKDNYPFLRKCNINTGDAIWDEDFSNITSDIFFSYCFNGTLVFEGKGGNIYGFDLNEHSLKWENDIRVEFWNGITGIDSLFFLYGYKIDDSNPYEICSAWEGNINTGKITEFYLPDMNPINPDSVPVNGVGGVDRILPWKNENGDIMLAIFIVKYYGPPVASYFSLYNFTKKEWVYQNKTLGYKNETLFGDPELFENRIYTTSMFEISCFDSYTGDKLWRTYYNNRFSTFGHVIADGKIIALIDGSIKQLVCHDVYTARQLWSTPSEGTSSTLNYLNGVVYFASMGDGRIHAVDAETGKYLWRIEPPDDSGLKYECAVIPGENGEKGKVIVSSFLNGYCYEAER